MDHLRAPAPQLSPPRCGYIPSNARRSAATRSARRCAAAGARCALLGAAAVAQAASAPRRRRAASSADPGACARPAGASGAYVVDLDTGQALFSGSANAPAAAGLGREALHDLDGAAALRPQRDPDHLGARHGHARRRRRLARHPVSARRRGSDVRLGGFDHSAYGGRRDDAAAGREPDPQRRDHVAPRARSSATSPTSTRCAARRRPATAPPPTSRASSAALAYDRGLANSGDRVPVPHPALFAAQQFAAALRGRGVKVPRRTRDRGRAARPPAPSCWRSVHSPRMATLIQLTNTPSDNFFAEMLLKDIGARFGGGGTTAGRRGGGARRDRRAGSASTPGSTTARGCRAATPPPRARW